MQSKDMEEALGGADEPSTPCHRLSSAQNLENYQPVLLRRKQVLAELLTQIVPRDRPCILEIGSGHGHFLTAYAAAHPDAYCLGIDILANRLTRSGKKRLRGGLVNVDFIKAEAGELLDAWPQDCLINSVFILFPDPWPKRRHHKNRLMQLDFLARLAKRVQIGGRLYFRTDCLDYINWTARHIQLAPNWTLKEAAAWPFEFETVFQSKSKSYGSLIAERS